LKKEDKSGKHSKKHSTNSLYDKDNASITSNHSLSPLSRDNSVSRTNPNINEDKRKNTSNENDGTQSIINIIKNNSTSLSNIFGGNSFSNYSVSSLAKVDEASNATERSRKKEPKTETMDTKKEVEESLTIDEANNNKNVKKENDFKLHSLNDSINSLLDSIDIATSLRSSDENLNSQGSISMLNDQISSSIDLITFMNNNLENESKKKTKNRKHNNKEQYNDLKDDDNINPFFLLNPELLEESSSEASYPAIESINIENDSFEKEKEKEKEKKLKNENGKEDEGSEKVSIINNSKNNVNKLEETEISEITNTDTEMALLKQIDELNLGKKDDKDSFLELAFNNNSLKPNDTTKKDNNEDTTISNDSTSKRNFEYINIPLDKEIKRAGINMTYLHKKEKPIVPPKAFSFNDANKDKEINPEDFRFGYNDNPKKPNKSSPYKNDDMKEGDLGAPKIQVNSRDLSSYTDQSSSSRGNRRIRRKSNRSNKSEKSRHELILGELNKLKGYIEKNLLMKEIIIL